MATLAVGGVAGASPSWSGPGVGVRSSTQAEPPLTLPAPLPNRQVRVPILMYHRVHATPPASQRPLTVHPADFARQMRWLKQHGYRTITQRELYEALFLGKRLGPKPILITFDDGYSEVFHKAVPVLKRLDMRATAYVISGRTLRSDTVFLTWHLLRALERDGVEIGSHTVEHRRLTSLSDGEALRELVQSRRAFERRLDHPVQWLAYPLGAYDSRIERLARRAGYVLAVTTEHGVVQSARSPLALRRLRILDSTGVSGLAAMLGS
ncbi:MAG TPA: polysaccharide deacetylase family protein [Gaiellaceae bacterium]|nr:polysaccharide deacetylase family protein [Gaiellaceae bacterium]